MISMGKFLLENQVLDVGNPDADENRSKSWICQLSRKGIMEFDPGHPWKSISIETERVG